MTSDYFSSFIYSVATDFYFNYILNNLFEFLYNRKIIKNMALPHFNTPNELYDGQLTFDSLTNTITTSSNGQTITIDPTASVTYTGASSGDYLMYDNSNVQWSINTFMIFDNDELSIDFNGNIEIDGKKEVNPSKIGLALLRAIESKLEASKKTDTITDICDV